LDIFERVLPVDVGHVVLDDHLCMNSELWTPILFVAVRKLALRNWKMASWTDITMRRATWPHLESQPQRS